MSDDVRDLAAVGALGALDADESDELLAEIEREPELALEIEDYRSTVSMLESNVARESPSHDLFPGILAEVAPAGTRAESAAAHVEGRGWSWRWALPAFAVGAAAMAAVFAIASVLSSEGLGTPDAVATVKGTPEFAGVHGEARIYGSHTADGTLALELADVPTPPEGKHYEVWVLRPSAGDAMESVGVFDPTSTEVNLDLGLPGAGDYVAVDVSVEPDAGPQEHSGTSLAGGKFEPEAT